MENSKENTIYNISSFYQNAGRDLTWCREQIARSNPAAVNALKEWQSGVREETGLFKDILVNYFKMKKLEVSVQHKIAERTGFFSFCDDRYSDMKKIDLMFTLFLLTEENLYLPIKELSCVADEHCLKLKTNEMDFSIVKEANEATIDCHIPDLIDIKMLVRSRNKGRGPYIK